MFFARAALLSFAFAASVQSQEARPLLLTASEWTHLRTLVQALSSDATARTYFRQTYRLSQTFTSEDHFSDYVAPWRPSLQALPEQQEKLWDVVDLRIIDKPDGLCVYVTFFKGTPPPGDLVFLRTTWVNGELYQLTLLKGSSNPRGGS